MITDPGDGSGGPAPPAAPASGPPDGAGHERSDVNARLVFWFASGLVVTVVLVHIGVAVLFAYLEHREEKLKASDLPLAVGQRRQGVVLPVPPRLEGIQHRQEFPQQPGPGPVGRPAEDYGWVDEKAGIARVPLDRAEDIALRRNLLPARPDPSRAKGAGRDRPPEGPGLGRGPGEGRP